MANRHKFQFSIPNGRIAKSLAAIPNNYKSLFVEMALNAWFSEKNQKDAATLNLNAFAPEKNRTPGDSRIRVTLSNRYIIAGLLAIPRKRRSFVAELALNAWLSSKPGKIAFEMLISGGREHVDSAEQTVEKSAGAVNDHKYFNLDDKEASDTERMIKIALAFK